MAVEQGNKRGSESLQYTYRRYKEVYGEDPLRDSTYTIWVEGFHVGNDSKEGDISFKTGLKLPVVAAARTRRRPAPLQLKPTIETELPPAAVIALRSARFINDINSIQYPPGILTPNPALNAADPPRKFKYQQEFLLQFQTVCTMKPRPNWGLLIRETIGDPSDYARPTKTSKVVPNPHNSRSQRPLVNPAAIYFPTPSSGFTS
ncbi:eukaryotic translation initiation factor 4G1, eIF4E-binding domain-containing protein [Kalaharituber pfeilii]|nr:eukaryotic translation initiation factor 4G1, eIF4E-binding domain-containing protein [Kalaharituber pfeilii]